MIPQHNAAPTLTQRLGALPSLAPVHPATLTGVAHLLTQESQHEHTSNP